MRSLYLPNRYSQQRQRQKPVDIYPVHLAMEATYKMRCGHEVHWENDPLKQAHIIQDIMKGNVRYDEILEVPQGIEFLSLPIPCRISTNAFDKRYQVYGNYKYHPATHMMAAVGCWHGRCSFCVENNKKYIARPIGHVSEEVDICNRMGIREIFDDSGTFPIGDWLEGFCSRMIAKPYKMVLGCNMRIQNVTDFSMMKAAGFRMILVGIESANQRTLDKINKGVKEDEIIPFFKKAAAAGLEPHIAVMFGYPWESKEEETKTLKLVHYLLRKGYAKTAQASIYSVPGVSSCDRGFVRRIYEAGFYPDFWINKIKDVRRWEDLLYVFKGIRKAIVND